MENITELKAEIDRLKDENERLRVNFKVVDRICGKLVVAMRCAIIESVHGKGDAAGISWVYDALLGPGYLPPDSEKNAQEYADREYESINKDLDECYEFYRARRERVSAGR